MLEPPVSIERRSTRCSAAAMASHSTRVTRRALRVTRAQCVGIADALRAVLERSIETGGSSISDFVGPDGRDGAYQDERCVYARKGEPCSRCGTPIARKLIGQRASHYCPLCQP